MGPQLGKNMFYLPVKSPRLILNIREVTAKKVPILPRMGENRVCFMSGASLSFHFFHFCVTFYSGRFRLIAWNLPWDVFYLVF